MARSGPLSCGLVVAVVLAASPAGATSVRFTANLQNDYDHGLQTELPAGFGAGEFTLELWIRPDTGYPIGPVSDGGTGQRTNWASEDEQPYSAETWWYAGNFLLDGFNLGGGFHNGTFSLQLYGGGRVRWLFGDGATAGPGGPWAVQAYPASSTPSLLDGSWHQITLVRRWSGGGGSDLELWVDGTQVATETSPRRTDMRSFWDNWANYSIAGWFWGSEKQAAAGTISQYEDFKGLLDELRFWSRAKTAAEISSGWAGAVTGTEPGLVGVYPFSEGTGSTVCDQLSPARCIQLTDMKSGFWSADTAPLGGGGTPDDLDGDGEPNVTDPCTLLSPLDQVSERTRMVFRNLAGAPGTHRFLWRGAFRPAEPGALSPHTKGVHLRIANADTTVLDVNIPGGLAGANPSTPCNSRDGWKSHTSGGGVATFAYRNLSGFVDAACTQSTDGVSVIRIVDRRAVGDKVRFLVKGRRGSYAAASGPGLQADLALSAQPAPGMASDEAMAGICTEYRWNGSSRAVRFVRSPRRY